MDILHLVNLGYEVMMLQWNVRFGVMNIGYIVDELMDVYEKSNHNLVSLHVILVMKHLTAINVIVEVVL